MTRSLEVLLDSLIDYAGLFPPAALDMTAAVTHYARYRTGPRRSLLGHFICPATRLESFEAAAAAHLNPETRPTAEGGPETAPWTLSLLPRGGADTALLLRSLTEDLDALAALERRRQGRVRGRALEMRLPPSIVAGEPAEPLLEGTAKLLEGTGIRRVFFEVAPETPHLDRLFVRLARGGTNRAPAVKIRTGGVEAAAFPSPEAVAGFLIAARKAKLAFKATAGLHHPLRRFDAGLETTMHGFLNLFVGAVLLAGNKLDGGELVELLADENPEAFRFTGEDLGWHGRRASVAEIVAARRDFSVSYGSCSFTEPIEDLETLGLLQP